MQLTESVESAKLCPFRHSIEQMKINLYCKLVPQITFAFKMVMEQYHRRRQKHASALELASSERMQVVV